MEKKSRSLPKPPESAKRLPAGSSHGQRRTRYSIKGHRPPSIRKIMWDLVHITRCGRKPISKNLIRARAENINRRFYTTDKADDLVRFLQNEHVLDELGGEEFNFDCREAIHVAAVCCGNDAKAAVEEFDAWVARRAESPPDSSEEIKLPPFAMASSSQGDAPQYSQDLSFDDMDEASSSPLQAEPEDDHEEEVFQTDPPPAIAPLNPREADALFDNLSRLEVGLASLRSARVDLDQVCVSDVGL